MPESKKHQKKDHPHSPYGEESQELIAKTQKRFAVINPSRMCQPLGAVQALLGIRGAMPLIHGSQGCSTYMRFQLCRHYREPINVSSTSMSEATVVYGGEKNLIQALNTITHQYKPELIGVTSSCLTETIGDDMDSIINKFLQNNHNKIDFPIIPISTPSYAGSHIESYDQTLKALVEKITHQNILKQSLKGLKDENKKSSQINLKDKINVITGLLSPMDVEEVKFILKEMNIESIVLTDNSQSLNSPLDGKVDFLPSKGTTIKQIRDTAYSKATIALSNHANSAGVFLEKEFGVKLFNLPTPIGLRATDEFIETLVKLKNNQISKTLKIHRGQLLDAMVDAHAYNYNRKVAIYGEPDMVVGLTRFTSELGMIPAVVCTGTECNKFKQEIELISSQDGHEIQIISGGDQYDLHQKVKEEEIEILMGNSYSARIAKEENIPLIRIGFPVFDRIGAQRIKIVGYRAGLSLLDLITNTIIEKYYDNLKEEHL
ncbi:MAG: nitrogenase component 1 [Methanobacteriaceae archaeon]|nr:nitrogenase component 1 [Methanobacteriaceae archaeon]